MNLSGLSSISKRLTKARILEALIDFFLEVLMLDATSVYSARELATSKLRRQQRGLSDTDGRALRIALSHGGFRLRVESREFSLITGELGVTRESRDNKHEKGDPTGQSGPHSARVAEKRGYMI